MKPGVIRWSESRSNGIDKLIAQPGAEAGACLFCRKVLLIGGRSRTVILAGTMPSMELSIAELKYLAKMNGESIFVMQMMERKSKGVSPDLPLAERIQAKFAVVLPEGLPDPFAEMRLPSREILSSRKRPEQARKGGKSVR